MTQGQSRSWKQAGIDEQQIFDIPEVLAERRRLHVAVRVVLEPFATPSVLPFIVPLNPTVDREEGNLEPVGSRRRLLKWRWANWAAS